jgi:hypothetical protein
MEQNEIKKQSMLLSQLIVDSAKCWQMSLI